MPWLCYHLSNPLPHRPPSAHPDTQIDEGIGYQGPNTTPGQLAVRPVTGVELVVEPTKPFVLNWEYIKPRDRGDFFQKIFESTTQVHMKYIYICTLSFPFMKNSKH